VEAVVGRICGIDKFFSGNLTVKDRWSMREVIMKIPNCFFNYFICNICR